MPCSRRVEWFLKFDHLKFGGHLLLPFTVGLSLVARLMAAFLRYHPSRWALTTSPAALGERCGSLVMSPLLAALLPRIYFTLTVTTLRWPLVRLRVDGDYLSVARGSTHLDAAPLLLITSVDDGSRLCSRSSRSSLFSSSREAPFAAG